MPTQHSTIPAGIRIGVVGATGLAGQTLLHILEERNWEGELLPCSQYPRPIQFRNQTLTTCSLDTLLDARPDLVFWMADASLARQWIPRFLEANIPVIDNSSAFRLEPNVPLIVPEVNGNQITGNELLIANPNCSTIQLVVALAPLLNIPDFTIRQICVATYQAVSGAGKQAVYQLMREQSTIPADFTIASESPFSSSPFPEPIAYNAIPLCGSWVSAHQINPHLNNTPLKTEGLLVTEEQKLLLETQKILGITVPICALTVRIPVWNCHGEAVFVTGTGTIDQQTIETQWQSAPSIIYYRDKAFPVPEKVHGSDQVHIGRLHLYTDATQETTTLSFWIVADNLRKGAATNAIQIAEQWFERRGRG